MIFSRGFVKIAMAASLAFSASLVGGHASAQVASLYIDNISGPLVFNFNADNEIFVYQGAQGSVLKFSNTGTNRSVFFENAEEVGSIYSDASGFIYLDSEFVDNELDPLQMDEVGYTYKVSPAGDRSEVRMGERGSSVYIDRDGKLYSIPREGSYIVKLNADYSVAQVFDDLSTGHDTGVITGVAFDSNGDIYVTVMNDSKVFKYSSDGSFQELNLGIAFPAAIDIDSNDNLYITDPSVGTIYKVAPGGSAVEYLTGINYPLGLRFDNNGSLYVSSYLDGAIYKIVEGPTPVPTMTEWAMILMGLALAGGAVVTVQRRRMAA